MIQALSLHGRHHETTINGGGCFSKAGKSQQRPACRQRKAQLSFAVCGFLFTAVGTAGCCKAGNITHNSPHCKPPHWCRVPFAVAGDFPPPALLPNISSAQEGSLVLARCLVFSHLPVTHIFFCKNGLVLQNHPVGPTQFSATLAIRLSAESSGTYCCGYRRRSNVGHIKTSSLSIPWLLTTGGKRGQQEVAPAPHRAQQPLR